MRNLIFRFDLDNGKYGNWSFQRVESLYFFKKEFSDLKFYFLYKT